MKMHVVVLIRVRRGLHHTFTPGSEDDMTFTDDSLEESQVPLHYLNAELVVST